MNLYKLSWALWVPGTVLIMLSWSHTVSPRVGWIGFWVALAGTGLSFFQKRARVAAPGGPGPASAALDDLAKLADLRDRGAISEEEFHAKRKALLDRVGPPPSNS